MPTASFITCVTCPKQLKQSDFPKKRAKRAGKFVYGYHPHCTDCLKTIRLAAKATKARLSYQSGGAKLSQKKWRMRKKYNLTMEEFEALLIKQNGVCAICHFPEATTCLSVDHCHKTGAVRGLLCGDCNRAIGLFGDDPTLLESARTYLCGTSL